MITQADGCVDFLNFLLLNILSLDVCIDGLVT